MANISGKNFKVTPIKERTATDKNSFSSNKLVFLSFFLYLNIDTPEKNPFI